MIGIPKFIIRKLLNFLKNKTHNCHLPSIIGIARSLISDYSVCLLLLLVLLLAFADKKLIEHIKCDLHLFHRDIRSAIVNNDVVHIPKTLGETDGGLVDLPRGELLQVKVGEGLALDVVDEIFSRRAVREDVILSIVNQDLVALQQLRKILGDMCLHHILLEAGTHYGV